MDKMQVALEREYHPCVVAHCGQFETDRHHRKQRSEGGTDSEANIAYLCRRHHDWVHNHLERSHDLGLICWGHESEPTHEIKVVRIKPVREHETKRDSGVESEIEKQLDL